jgi:hypothetical protein
MQMQRDYSKTIEYHVQVNWVKDFNIVLTLHQTYQLF